MSDPNRSTMATSEPFLNSGDFQEDLGMFEAATKSTAVDLPEVALGAVLLATDGSNQDATARSVALKLAAAVGAKFGEDSGLKTVADLQAAKKAHNADMLVLPVPFGSDIGDLREESLGEVIDRMLALDLPILAIRQPLEEGAVGDVFEHVIVPLTPDNPRSIVALAWGCKILNGSGTLTIVEIANAELKAEAEELREDAESPSANAAARVTRVLTRYFGGSISAVQRKAAECGISINVEIATGRFVESTLAQLDDEPGLVIIAGTTDRRSDSFHQEADAILASRYPVLIV